jgi:hypothetical protein
MTHDSDKEEHGIMKAAAIELQPHIQGRPHMLIVGFDMEGGMKICAISNVSKDDQLAMMEMLKGGYEPAPTNVTFN